MNQSGSESDFHDGTAEFHCPAFDLLEILADGQAFRQIIILATEYYTRILFSSTDSHIFCNNMKYMNLEQKSLGLVASEVTDLSSNVHKPLRVA